MAKRAEVVRLDLHRATASRRAKALEDAARAVERMSSRLLKETAQLAFKIRWASWIDRQAKPEELLSENDLWELADTDSLVEDMLILMAHAREVAETLRGTASTKPE